MKDDQITEANILAKAIGDVDLSTNWIKSFITCSFLKL